MVSVGIKMVKQYTTLSTISLYAKGIMFRARNRNKIRKQQTGLKTALKTAETIHLF